MDILKEIEVTDSFYELDKKVRKCQTYKGTYDSCITGYFHEKMRLNCGCVPFAISNSTINNKKVFVTCKLIFDIKVLLKVSFCSSEKELNCVETTIKESTPAAQCLR